MTAQSFHQYERNGEYVILPLTDRKVIDRLTPAQRTRYKGEGVCLGAYVNGIGQYLPWQGRTPDITGQVWSKAGDPRTWWVVDRYGHPWLMHEESMILLRQARDYAPDEPLPDAI